MSKNVKTFRGLAIEGKLTANDIAQLVKVNGTLYRNEWAAWEAATPGDESMPEEVEAALSALAEYASASFHNSMKSVEDLHDPSIHHPLDDFGFYLNEDNELFVDKPPMQSLQEKFDAQRTKLADATMKIDELREEIVSLSQDIRISNQKAEEVDAKSSVHELRAIAIHTWLQSNPTGTRRDLWDEMHKIDPDLFRSQGSPGAAKRAMDLVNDAHKERYGHGIEYLKGNN